MPPSLNPSVLSFSHSGTEISPLALDVASEAEVSLVLPRSLFPLWPTVPEMEKEGVRQWSGKGRTSWTDSRSVNSYSALLNRASTSSFFLLRTMGIICCCRYTWWSCSISFNQSGFAICAAVDAHTQVVAADANMKECFSVKCEICGQTHCSGDDLHNHPSWLLCHLPFSSGASFLLSCAFTCTVCLLQQKSWNANPT